MRPFVLSLILCLAACRSAPTRQEVIDNAVNARVASDALDESQAELGEALDALSEADTDAERAAAQKRAAAAVKQSAQAAEQAKTALEQTQKLLIASENARAQAEKERDENARDAGRWRVTQWVLMLGGPLLLIFAVWRKLS